MGHERYDVDGEGGEAWLLGAGAGEAEEGHGGPRGVSVDLLLPGDGGMPCPAAYTVERSALLYLEPRSTGDLPPGEEPVNAEMYAQCATCAMWQGGARRCTIHGPDLEVRGEDSCGLYVPGPNAPEEMEPRPHVRREESGFGRGLVQCRRCVDYRGGSGTEDRGVCMAMRVLTRSLPDRFALPDGVSSRGCCNLWRERPEVGPMFRKM